MAVIDMEPLPTGGGVWWVIGILVALLAAFGSRMVRSAKDSGPAS